MVELLYYTHTHKFNSSTVHNISPVGGANMVNMHTRVCKHTHPLHSPWFGDLIGQNILSNFPESFS